MTTGDPWTYLPNNNNQIQMTLQWDSEWETDVYINPNKTPLRKRKTVERLLNDEW